MRRIKPASLIVFISLFLFRPQVLSGAESNKPEPATFIIADFNNGAMFSNLQTEMGTWEMNPEDEAQSIEASLDKSIKMGKSGYSLKIDYNVGSPKNAVNGFWMQMRFFDASPYDHFEFYVKGDKDKGSTGVFKIEFKKLNRNPDGEEETVRGSFIVKGVTGEWRKISIPLNVMNGITDWKQMGEFVITFEKRRVDSLKGTLYFDDLAFVKTGSPGPSISDPVEHKAKKTKTALPPAEFAKFLIKRLKGFPSKVFLDKTFPKDDRAMLMEIAKDTWNYFDMFVDKNYQLPIDNVEFAADGTVSGGTK
ncbi:MAG: carbohydrate binding domain-containing protein, partial [Candidatus Omnitrophota bacterium]